MTSPKRDVDRPRCILSLRLSPSLREKSSYHTLRPARQEFLLDVREPVELAVENVPEALNIPVGQLRARLGELPRDREIDVICRSGQRAYLATRILLQHGSKARNVSGGMLSRYQRLLLTN